MSDPANPVVSVHVVLQQVFADGSVRDHGFWLDPNNVQITSERPVEVVWDRQGRVADLKPTDLHMFSIHGRVVEAAKV